MLCTSSARAVVSCCSLGCRDPLRLQRYRKDNAGVDLEII